MWLTGVLESHCLGVCCPIDVLHYMVSHPLAQLTNLKQRAVGWHLYDSMFLRCWGGTSNVFCRFTPYCTLSEIAQLSMMNALLPSQMVTVKGNMPQGIPPLYASDPGFALCCPRLALKVWRCDSWLILWLSLGQITCSVIMSWWIAFDCMQTLWLYSVLKLWYKFYLGQAWPSILIFEPIDSGITNILVNKIPSKIKVSGC